MAIGLGALAASSIYAPIAGIPPGRDSHPNACVGDNWGDCEPACAGVDLAAALAAFGAMAQARESAKMSGVPSGCRSRLAVLTLVLVGLETWTHVIVHRHAPQPVAVQSNLNHRLSN